MYLVADTVSGAGKINPIPRGHTLEVTMVVGVLKPDLNGVVVDVADRQLRRHPLQSHRLELKIGHRAGGILGKGLVDPHPNLRSRLEST